MIPRLRPKIGFDEFQAAIFGSNGISEFEYSFAEIAEQEFAIAFPHGRTGLIALLQVLGSPGQYAVVPAYTCVVVPHAVIYAGQLPKFIDCDSDSVNMDLRAAQKAIGSDTSAVIATSIFGDAVNLDQLDALRARYPSVPIIQDCAHSMFTRWNGRLVHKEGIAALFGLNFGKVITSVFGGMVTTNDGKLAEALRAWRKVHLIEPGWRSSLGKFAYFTAGLSALSPPGFWAMSKIKHSSIIGGFTQYYKPDQIDMPKDYLQQMTNLQARIGTVQTRRYGAIAEHRLSVASLYNELLADTPGLELHLAPNGTSYSYYAPRVNHRERVIELMANQRIELGHVLEYAVPNLPAYAQRNGNEATFPLATQLSQTVVNLPLHVSRKECRRIAGKFRKVVGGLGNE